MIEQILENILNPNNYDTSKMNLSVLLLLLVFVYGFQFLLFAMSVINSIFGPFLKNEKKELPDDLPLVSILLPMRNEENNVERVITSLINQDYKNYEILVLDDNSEDNTLFKLKSINSVKLNIINGKALPEAWLGKNWACHQLSQNAKGDILIFTDADNFYEKDAVSKSISAIINKKLGMLSAFPQQKMESLPEKLIVPLVDIILYSLLPLRLVSILNSKSLAAANGQWIVIRKGLYDLIGGHQVLKNKVVEDVEMMRLAKEKSIRVATFAGTGLVYGKMYNNMKEIIEGFTKNLYGLTGGNTFAFFFLLLEFVLITFLPFYLFFTPYRILAIATILISRLWRLILAIRFKHNIFVSVLLHPGTIFFLTFIGLRSYYFTKNKLATWKGRTIAV
jgi:chlorobactene glucosyltransferase